MLKNVAGQKYRVFAFNRSTNVPVTGDAANISAKISKDYAAAVASNDVAPSETEDGYYVFDLTQAETNCDDFAIYPESTTADVQVIGCPPSTTTRLDDDRGFLVNLTIKYASGAVVPYCEVILTTSNTSDSTDVYRNGRADEVGKFDVRLPAGTYYLWRNKSGSTFTDPATVTVASDGTTTIT